MAPTGPTGRPTRHSVAALSTAIQTRTPTATSLQAGGGPPTCDPTVDPQCQVIGPPPGQTPQPGGPPQPGSSPPPGSDGVSCSGTINNGGSTDAGVTGSQINIASAYVSPSSVGGGFLGQAEDGVTAAVQLVNSHGGICGRRVAVTAEGDNWDGPTGKGYIDTWISSGSIFALVGMPDSQGLAQAIDSGDIRSAQIPVVGTDGLLKDQYHDPWVYPVAASTVTNMHILADYAYSLNKRHFAIVYDTTYKFGQEGADALANEVHRLSGATIGSDCSSGFCGVPGDPSQYSSYSSYSASFNGYCNNHCDAVVMLLEPAPAEAWMNAENGNTNWYQTLYGGEPLFNDSVGTNCVGCGKGRMLVWTGYHPYAGDSRNEADVQAYKQALANVAPHDDPQNLFTEGAYIGTKLFLAAVQSVANQNQSLTRANLKAALDTQTFDLKLTSAPIKYAGLGGGLHNTNTAMEEFLDSYSGNFIDWTYQGTGWVQDKGRPRASSEHPPPVPRALVATGRGLRDAGTRCDGHLPGVAGTQPGPRRHGDGGRVRDVRCRRRAPSAPGSSVCSSGSRWGPLSGSWLRSSSYAGSAVRDPRRRRSGRWPCSRSASHSRREYSVRSR